MRMHALDSISRLFISNGLIFFCHFILRRCAVFYSSHHMIFRPADVNRPAFFVFMRMHALSLYNDEQF